MHLDQRGLPQQRPFVIRRRRSRRANVAVAGLIARRVPQPVGVALGEATIALIARLGGQRDEIPAEQGVEDWRLRPERLVIEATD